MKMLLINPMGRTTRQLPVCGRSGKTYGYAGWNQNHGGYIFEMPLADYIRFAPDICMQNVPLQSWYGLPIDDTVSPNRQTPEIEQILTGEFNDETDQNLAETAGRLILERDGLKLALESLESSRNAALVLARANNDELRKMVKTYAPEEKGNMTRERMIEILLEATCSPARQS